MTAAERLLQLAGTTAGTAAALLLTIGAGATAGDALVAYSGLAEGSAAELLLTERAALNVPGVRVPAKPRRAPDDDEALLLCGLI